MTFRVKLSEAAQSDAEELYERVTAAAPFRGPLWYNLMAAIESLRHSPRRCPYAPENYAFPVEVRHLLFGRKPNVYRIPFTIEGDTVYVLCIRGPHQQPIQP